jgi:hypothetical protein
MTRPKAYITRRIPQPTIDIVAAANDYAIWDSEDQAVPHIGSATVTTRTRMATIAATNLVHCGLNMLIVQRDKRHEMRLSCLLSRVSNDHLGPSELVVALTEQPASNPINPEVLEQ